MWVTVIVMMMMMMMLMMMVIVMQTRKTINLEENILNIRLTV
jgi:hypothetical protein